MGKDGEGMRYFIDTEFAEAGDRIVPTIDLISIGIVAEDGREFYAESSEFSEELCNKWVKEHVFPLLGPPERRLSRAEIRDKIAEFVGDDQEPEFWAYYADYDWVVFCWLFGAMVDLPRNFPKLCLDLQQWWIQLGRPNHVKPEAPPCEHDALHDARWNKQLHEALTHYARALRESSGRIPTDNQ